MFSPHSWPEAIVHIDGDAFFASVMQSVNPSLKGKPIATGHERGIATAFSYEAKRMGVKRGMTFSQIKKVCPSCIFIESDYDLFALVSRRMFDIMKTYSPVVEEYSIDEGFIDIKGLRRVHRKTYEHICLTLKKEIELKLGITVSVGLSITKSLAKLASGFRKPSGFTPVQGKHIEYLLKQVPVQKIWGIGPNTAALLQKQNIQTSLDFALMPETRVASLLSKPFYEIWHELHGRKIYNLNPQAKETYKSISKTETFTPPTKNKHILWSRLFQHIEEAFEKARRYQYAVKKIHIFLKTQQFSYRSGECSFITPTAYPLLIRKQIYQTFESLYDAQYVYRTTGCTLSELTDAQTYQNTLFDDVTQQEKTKKLYDVLIRERKVDFGTSFFLKGELQNKKKLNTALPFLSIHN